jgi:hypothetical protein
MAVNYLVLRQVELRVLRAAVPVVVLAEALLRACRESRQESKRNPVRFLRFFKLTLPHETDYVNTSFLSEDKHGWIWAIRIGGMTDDSIYIHSLLHVVYLGGLRLNDFLYFSWWWPKLKKLFVKRNEVSEVA